MLSILIPTYNYNISNLITKVHKQCTISDINFEIICFDDNSYKFTTENKSTIDSLNNTRIIISKQNLGSINSRQILSNEAIYNWLLFIDADVIPKSEKFIKNYISETPKNDAIYGGFTYSNLRPNDDLILRWKYGKNFEEINAKKRNLKPYQVIISANFLIKKTIFNKINSVIETKNYGLDNYFAALLKQNNINVFHINNEVYHLGLENNLVYLNKIEEAITTLLYLFKNNKMFKHDNKLLSSFEFFKKYKLNYLIAFIYKLFNSFIKKDLLGKNPNLTLLQFYKILFICYKDLNKKQNV